MLQELGKHDLNDSNTPPLAKISRQFGNSKWRKENPSDSVSGLQFAASAPWPTHPAISSMQCDCDHPHLMGPRLLWPAVFCYGPPSLSLSRWNIALFPHQIKAVSLVSYATGTIDWLGESVNGLEKWPSHCPDARSAHLFAGCKDNRPTMTAPATSSRLDT